MKVVVFLVVVIAIAFKLGWIGGGATPRPDFVEQYGDEVVLYSTEWCGYCKKTRELLWQNDIPFTELDIETSARGKYEFDQLNGRGIPLMIIEGEIVRGYNPKRIQRLSSHNH